ncbi:MAG: hypothetical protein HY302_10580 [Opitutae bacterium]|nr:hypothetical protein [Opitutae bacterium]
MSMLCGLLLAPLALLLAWGCGVLVWGNLVAGWHSGAGPTVLGCVVLAAGLLAWPRKRPAVR